MIIISPSKNLNVLPEEIPLNPSIPLFIEKTNYLTNILKNIDKSGLKSLMNISDSLASINHERFSNFDDASILKKPAVFLFAGGTFDGLAVRSLDKKSLNIAQEKLRILSGLYGLLKPMDKISPYRLEMGTKMQPLIESSLHDYWTREITETLNKELKTQKMDYLFNLASKEYFDSINTSKLNVEIVNFDFKRKKNNSLINPGMLVKKFRGMMARTIIQNNISNINEILKIEISGMKLDSFNKKSNTFLFLV